MTDSPHSAGPLDTVRERVRALRRGRYTADQLAEQLQAVGLKWDRNVIASFETGRRKTLSVEELLALAYVLDVAPIHLLVAPDDARWYRYVPNYAAAPDRVRAWIRGEHWMMRRGGDERRYYTEVPDDEWVPPRPQTDEERQQQREERWRRIREDEAAGLITVTETEGGGYRIEPTDAWVRRAFGDDQPPPRD